MKSQVIIFSSSENLDIARDFANKLNEDDEIECTVWQDLPFALSNYTQRDLAVFGKKYDFALLIFGYEDKAVVRAKECDVTRDNVIYEYGLMSGLIGGDRCFIIDCISDDIINPHLPSDVKGITTLRFNTNLTNRRNILHECARKILSEMKRLGPNKHVSEDLMAQLSVVGLSAFYTTRSDFRLRKSDDGSSLELLKDYLSLARKSIKIIAFTFALSNTFGQVDSVFREKLKSFPDFTVTISLLNPFDPLYYSSCYMTVYRDSPDVLITEAKQNVDLLRKFRDSLDAKDKKRFSIRFHNTALFESAILIDDDESDGRIQIELKPYRVNVYESFAFEIKKSESSSAFYNKIRNSYDQLLNGSESLDEVDIFRDSPGSFIDYV